MGRAARIARRFELQTETVLRWDWNEFIKVEAVVDEWDE
jgi:hypothetical protein